MDWKVVRCKDHKEFQEVLEDMSRDGWELHSWHIGLGGGVFRTQIVETHIIAVFIKKGI